MSASQYPDELVIRSLVNRVPLCGCGSAGRMWAVVEAILHRAEGHSYDAPEERPGFYDAIPELDLSPTAVEFAAQVLDTSGFLEHGSGIGWAWLTEGGRRLLAFLRANPDRNAWPEWVMRSTFPEPFELTDKEMREAGLT